MLCEGGFEGIYGYTPHQVGDMTLDMIYMLLTSKKLLRSDPGSKRTVKMSNAQVAELSKDGTIKGRDKEGNPIKGRIQGKSWASQLMEQEQSRKEEQLRKAKKRRKRRRGKIDSAEDRRRLRDGS